ncbi:MAG: UDP-N-acetylmuramoyl-tripeptide--D-alanyl-D-alanine ligase [Oscillospiraceae bacterium]|nr:UDP-N-acetylmuramoyl-tripeptide--D-alanyl-D-alanine ligase [Oscillospiraceae bacterium]
MKKLMLQQLAQWCNGTIVPCGADCEINAIQQDSRDIRHGDLFVALAGEHFDGHNFVKQAAETGAAAALVGHETGNGIPEIVVKDTLIAYGDIARKYLGSLRIPVVAITGSVGKTTTKEMIFGVLAGKYRVSKTQGNHNNNLGLPITIMEMAEDTQMAVLELGMNHFGEMSYLTSIARPDVVVITNIGTMHIEHLGTREGILKAKLEIMQGIRDDGVAVFNGDEPLLWNLREGTHRRVYFGIENERCDVLAKDICQKDGGMDFTVDALGKSFRVFVPQEGRHTVYNALAAIAVGLLQGVEPDIIVRQLGLFHNTGMRQRVFEENGCTIIDDCYNAGPESMEAALNVLKEHKCEGRRIAVLGDMLELGTRAMAEHYRVGRLAAAAADVILTYGKHSERIITGAVTGGMSTKNAVHYDDQSEMAQALARAARPGDVLLFKGSRGIKMERVMKEFLEQQGKDQ